MGSPPAPPRHLPTPQFTLGETWGTLVAKGPITLLTFISCILKTEGPTKQVRAVTSVPRAALLHSLHVRPPRACALDTEPGPRTQTLAIDTEGPCPGGVPWEASVGGSLPHQSRVCQEAHRLGEQSPPEVSRTQAPRVSKANTGPECASTVGPEPGRDPQGHFTGRSHRGGQDPTESQVWMLGKRVTRGQDHTDASAQGRQDSSLCRTDRGPCGGRSPGTT